MKTKNYFLFLLAIFLIAIIFSACSAKAQSNPASGMEKLFSDAGLRLLSQKVTPRDFSLPLVSEELDDEVKRLTALNGKVVFLNFWATWCGPCRDEMPSMEVLYNRYKDRGFEILAVNCMEGKEDVISFMKDNGFSFPVALDLDGKVGSSYGIQAIPTTFIIDREGKIIVRLVGSINWNTEKMYAAMESLLNS